MPRVLHTGHLNRSSHIRVTSHCLAVCHRLSLVISDFSAFANASYRYETLRIPRRASKRIRDCPRFVIFLFAVFEQLFRLFDAVPANSLARLTPLRAAFDRLKSRFRTNRRLLRKYYRQSSRRRFFEKRNCSSLNEQLYRRLFA